MDKDLTVLKSSLVEFVAELIFSEKYLVLTVLISSLYFKRIFFILNLFFRTIFLSPCALLQSTLKLRSF